MPAHLHFVIAPLGVASRRARSEVYSTYGYIPTGGSRDHRQITFRFCRSLADHLQILDLVDSWIASCSLACRYTIKGSVVETCALIQARNGSRLWEIVRDCNDFTGLRFSSEHTLPGSSVSAL